MSISMIYLPLVEGDGVYVSVSRVESIYPVGGKVLSCGIQLVSGETYRIDMTMLSVLEKIDPHHPDLSEQEN